MGQIKKFAELTTAEQIQTLTECVTEILEQFDLGDFEFESINHEYNSTFKVTSGYGQTYALRINLNSGRTLPNLKAEIAWVSSIESVSVARPQLNRAGSAISFGWHEVTKRSLAAVLYSWLDGEEPGDEPSEVQIFALGAAMAKLHDESSSFVVSNEVEFPDYSDVFWGAPNLLFGADSALSDAEQTEVAKVFNAVERAIAELRLDSPLQPIHADLHPWNIMWHEGELAIFDFDDSGLGLPVQDLMTALYYLDTPEQEAALLEGYASVRSIPEHTLQQRTCLLLQRRLLLLNYLYESANPEHIKLIPEYKAETFRRIAMH
jgi:Ser/Thr protein kinase RdoA (MazF antagonist)